MSRAISQKTFRPGNIVGTRALGYKTDDNLRSIQRRFLVAFAACANLTKAARWAKVSRDMHYRWLESDANYRKQFNETRLKIVGLLEDAAFEMAIEGERMPLMYNGRQVRIEGVPQWVSRRNATVLLRLLEAHCPEKYTPRRDYRFDGDISNLTETELEVLLTQLEERAKLAAASGDTIEAEYAEVGPESKSVAEAGSAGEPVVETPDEQAEG